MGLEEMVKASIPLAAATLAAFCTFAGWIFGRGGRAASVKRDEESARLSHIQAFNELSDRVDTLQHRDLERADEMSTMRTRLNQCEEARIGILYQLEQERRARGLPPLLPLLLPLTDIPPLPPPLPPTPPPEPS